MIAKNVYIPMGLFLLLGSFLQAAPLLDRLEHAVSESDVIGVEGSLKELSNAGSVKERTEVLADVSLMAADVLSKLKKDRSILTDATDFVHASVGSFVGLVSAYWLMFTGVKNYYDFQGMSKHDRRYYGVAMGASALGTLIGGYYAYKGLTCAAQNKRITQARKVKKLLADQAESQGSTNKK